MARRSAHSRAFWERVVAAVEARKGTHEQIAARFGVGVPALRYWVRRLRKRPSGRSVRLLPVRVASPAAASPGLLELGFEQGVLRFTEGTDADYVAQVVVAVRTR